MNGFDLSTISGIFVGSTEYSAIYKGSTLIWESNPTYDKQYLTFESLEDGNVIGFKAYSANTTTKTIQYSTDKVHWTSATSTSSGTTLATLNTGDKLYIKGDNATYDTYVNSTHEYNYFTSSKTFNLYGNIMSLVNASTFKTLTSFSSNNVFISLFTGAKIVDASNLVLPLSTTNSCYMSMFNSCNQMTKAPKLPATTLSDNCYRQMFFGCSNLKIAPVLPATTLANACYYGMFRGCSKILEAPVLPATTLVTNCYNQMFRYCSKLNYIKMLATDISATSCLDNWVDGVASNGSFIKDANMTSLSIGPSGIPSGWISYNNDEDYYKDEYLTFESLEDDNVITWKMNTSTTPEKTIEYSTDKITWTSATSTTSGTTLATLNTDEKLYLRGNNTQYCISSGNQNKFTSTKKFNLSGNIMSLINSSSFSNLTSLANLGQHTFRTMFQATQVVDASMLQLPATTLIAGCYNAMFQGCAFLYNAPKLPATTLASHCYMQLFASTNLTVAPELPATTMKSQCYQSMFANCTSLTAAPVLPATTLAQYCYYRMFRYCSKLNYIKMLATDISALSCLDDWIDGVASTGTFIKDASMTSLPTGTSGIPSGWTVQDVV